MVRDVALRYRWMAKKENARKTKDDLNPLRKMKDKKGYIVCILVFGVLFCVVYNVSFSVNTTWNKVNCGVYLMRHMESYVREDVARWECGLFRGDQTELDSLRLHYMKEICTTDINSHNTRNVACALRFLSSPLATSND
nr:zinc finger BED domain-containing protein RICESLEEPER 2-like [Ipomoea batatas]